MSCLAMKISALYITSFSLFSFLQKLSTYMIPLKRLEMADSLSVRSARYASYISRPAMKMNLDFAVEVKNFRLPRRCSTVVFLFRDVPPLGRYFSFENSGCVSPEVLYGTSILSSSSNTKNILGWNGSLTIRLIISIR